MLISTQSNSFLMRGDPIKRVSSEPSTEPIDRRKFLHVVEQSMRLSRIKEFVSRRRCNIDSEHRTFALQRKESTGEVGTQQVPLVEYIKSINFGRPRFASVDPTGCSPWNIRS